MIDNRVVDAKNVEVASTTERMRVSSSDVASSYLITPTESWDWSKLRDYVITQIESCHGRFGREPMREVGIFKRFFKTYGPDAIAIAKWVFEREGGYWRGQVVTVGRFCKAADAEFALPILAKLRDIS